MSSAITAISARAVPAASPEQPILTPPAARLMLAEGWLLRTGDGAPIHLGKEHDRQDASAT